MNRAIAACKCASLIKFTKAQFEREMRKMEETPLGFAPGEEPGEGSFGFG